jgi:hypothetical protein
MLAGSIFAAIDRAFRPAPEVFPEAAVDLIFGLQSFGHASLFVDCGFGQFSAKNKALFSGPQGIFGENCQTLAGANF